MEEVHGGEWRCMEVQVHGGACPWRYMMEVHGGAWRGKSMEVQVHGERGGAWRFMEVIEVHGGPWSEGQVQKGA